MSAHGNQDVSQVLAQIDEGTDKLYHHIIVLMPILSKVMDAEAH